MFATALLDVPWAISEPTLVSVSKRVFTRNIQNKNMFHLPVYFHGNQTQFVVKRFAQRRFMEKGKMQLGLWSIHF